MKTDYFVVDVEAHYDSPCPNLHYNKGMTEFGCVWINEPLEAFHGIFNGREKAEYKSQVSRITTVVSKDWPTIVMPEFKEWLLKRSTSPRFISDNNGYDWQFINWEFWSICGINPFGHSSTNLGSLYKGMEKNVRVNFKHLRDTKHTHNPVDDCVGNVEAFMKMITRGLII